MNIKKGDLQELTIEKVVHGGRGLSRINGRVVFVDKVVPGDRVVVKVFKVKKDFAQARVVELIEESPYRAEAPCAYSQYCGGCSWQSIQYEKQLEYKRDIVEDSLSHIGKITGFQIDHALPSSRIFGYRNKMEFSFSDKRWLLPQEMAEKKEDKGFALGLHIPGTFDKIIDIGRCLIQKEKGNEITAEVRRYAKRSGMPAYGLKSHQGFWRYLTLRSSHHFNEWMVNIVTSRHEDLPVRMLAAALNDRFGEIVSIVNNINTRKGGTAVGEWEIVLSGERSIKDKIGPFTFEISPNSFFQTNTPMAEKLYDWVKTFSSLTGKETVVDLYCGTGAISIFLSPYASRVIGMDISESSIEDAGKNSLLNGVDNCEFQCGDVKTLLSQLKEAPDLLIVDPPRTGMHNKVIDQILDLLPGRIIYVSCNPATMARDVALLKEKYMVERVQPIDLFPHTYHIESVVKLERIS
jgi:23S rRNA (uracil1939-C5)-methyltransferase